MVTLQQKRNKSLSHNDEALHRTSFNGTGTNTQRDKDGKKLHCGIGLLPKMILINQKLVLWNFFLQKTSKLDFFSDFKPSL